MSQPIQITREAIHNGFSGLSEDSKWRRSLNFRFFRKRTVVVPFKKPLFSLEGPLEESEGNFHTAIGGPNNSTYLIGHTVSAWAQSDGTSLPLYTLSGNCSCHVEDREHWKFLEIRGQYNGSLLDEDLLITISNVEGGIKFTNGSGEYNAPRDSFVPIGRGLEAVFPQDVEVGMTWTLAVFPLTEPEGLVHTNSQHSASVCDAYFVGPQTNLTRLYGNLALQVVDSARIFTPNNGAFERSVPSLKSSCMAQSFGHLIISDHNVVRWSDLNSFWSWNPDTSNESDYRILDWECQAITAIVRANDIVYIHFPDAFYPMSYVGKPAIYNISQQSHGTGAISQSSIIVHKNAQYFISLDNFYQTHPVDGNIPIGEEVWKEFTEECVDPKATWTYVDQVNREICWVYKTVNGFSRILAFNYIERHWSRYSANNLLDHDLRLEYATEIDHTVEPCVVTETDKVVGYKNVWLRWNGLVEDARQGDPLEECLDMEQPFLETDHFTYGDIFNKKCVDVVVIDSDYRLPWSGWKVEVSAKERVTDEAEFEDFGLWRKYMIHTDSRSVDSTSFQYRLKLDSVLEEDGIIKVNGRTFDESVFRYVWDGTLYGSLAFGLPYRSEEFGYWDGDGQPTHCPDFGCELYAWGERVEGVLKDVGPDK